MILVGRGSLRAVEPKGLMAPAPLVRFWRFRVEREESGAEESVTAGVSGALETLAHPEIRAAGRVPKIDRTRRFLKDHYDMFNRSRGWGRGVVWISSNRAQERAYS